MEFGQVHSESAAGTVFGFIVALLVSSTFLYVLLWFTRGVPFTLVPALFIGVGVVSGLGVVLRKWLL